MRIDFVLSCCLTRCRCAMKPRLVPTIKANVMYGIMSKHLFPSVVSVILGLYWSVDNSPLSLPARRWPPSSFSQVWHAFLVANEHKSTTIY
ncbi:hypothetical protein DNZ94_16085 [Salmonella enterica subsp. enterica serovar Anatum]|nr:hypothetical protein [Salmonella enterica subsp. enterica serovar Typhimurium str. UK-1]EBV1744737.1 hypothetical protein [Salmonella enterica subsp. enterica serovar Anatum]ECV5769311.1 hypothetical protein [Salmonella enterica subsp. enterica serovar Typhimurium]EEJ7184987.1 hypothetical protein [Salmonella enterica subsp. enterica]EBV4199340.1 hypothetical protein [Salmonella enterica subsp. enterica serovar Anatum]